MNLEFWLVEHNFWYTKWHRAFLRSRVALENNDKEKMAIAEKQMTLYHRRLESVVPESEKQWRRDRKEAELHAALNEE